MIPKIADYHLILVPKRGEKVYKFFSKVIRNIAKEHQTPTFEPHVTLLNEPKGSMQEIFEKTQELAGELSSFKIKLGKIGSNNLYFQILFLEVEQTSEVMKANSLAYKIFGMRKKKYFPHLSLAYENLSKRQVSALKKLIIDQYPSSVGMSFFVNSIEIWSTKGTPEEWHPIKIFSLEKS